MPSREDKIGGALAILGWIVFGIGVLWLYNNKDPLVGLAGFLVCGCVGIYFMAKGGKLSEESHLKSSAHSLLFLFLFGWRMAL